MSRIVFGIRKFRSIFMIKEGDRGVISVPEIFYIEYISYFLPVGPAIFSHRKNYVGEWLIYLITFYILIDKMDDIKIIDLSPDNIADYGVCGYKDVKKHEELRNKIDWFGEYYKKGLRIKVLFSRTGGYQGMIEYLPGEYAHRPVDAKDYMFIHCIFVGFRREYKGKGFGSLLIDECVRDAKAQKFKGVAVVTRNGPFMAHNDIFLKKGFQVADSAEPDFELLVQKNDRTAKDPKFRSGLANIPKEYSKGLTIIRSSQCPYSVKNVNAIMESSRKKFKITPRLIDLKSSGESQNAPCAFGSFCIIYNGEIIAHHPISNTRFENIMRKKI